MKKWIAFLNADGAEVPMIITAPDTDSAIKRLHKTWLKSAVEKPRDLKPEKSQTNVVVGISDNWCDFRDDIIEYGIHTLYGPYNEIPTI